MSRKPQRRSGHAGAWLASAGAAGMVLAVAGSGGHGHHGLTGILDSLHATTVSSGGSVNGNEALANRLAARLYGWTGSQRGCLDSLWSGESGFRANADTRASGLDPADASVFAYGIPQARGHGPVIGGITAPYPAPFQAANPPSLGGTSDARTQIRWGLHYVFAIYKTPCGALAFKQANANQGY